MSAQRDNTVRIAMWSGPRNISTAMLRAWENRSDTVVVDEPMYAFFLNETGKAHPISDEVIAAGETDWRCVTDFLTGPVPGGKRVFYQKHMAHHLLDSVGRDWLAMLSHGLLLRDPAEMLASLCEVIPEPALEDTGLPQQLEIFNALRVSGPAPPVVDSRDILENPEGMLRALCSALDVPFEPAMLSWQAGPRDSDGVWAPHWYASVYASTGFKAYQTSTKCVPDKHKSLLADCVAIYTELSAHKITV